jgi:probable rRNA maturation factor
MASLRTAMPRHVVARAVRHALSGGLANLIEQGMPAKKRPIAAELTVRVVDSVEGRALNLQYRARDYATNVLTFDYAFAPVLLADIVLCAPVLEDEASEQGKDLRAHGVHLLVHGTLHALGFDHEHSQQDAATMEALESQILQGLGIDNPYKP